VHKRANCSREALLNAIPLAAREEIREALIQDGFSFDDRLLDIKEASTVLQVSPDCSLPQLSQITVHTEARAEALRFSYRGIQMWIRRDVGL
jgi:hypothetical protein